MERKKLELISICKDDWGRIVYKDLEGNLFKGCVDGGKLKLYTCSSVYGEAIAPVEDVKKYKGLVVEVDNSVEIESEDCSKKFSYMMLSRLKQDCDYFLGNGNRSKKHLWAEDEVKQIEEMKKLYNSFNDNEKPEWLSYEDILDYEKKMI